MAEQLELVESKTEFLDLNDDCLEFVFNLCDSRTIVSLSRVCKRINAIVTTIHFPRITELKYLGWRDDAEEFIDILAQIGKNLVQLDIQSPGRKHYWRENNINIYELVRSVGDRVRKIRIYERRMSEMIQAIRPALQLQHLEELRIESKVYCAEMFELRSFCPNLKRLRITGISFSSSVGHWPRLEDINLYDEDLSMEEFQVFMQKTKS